MASVLHKVTKQFISSVNTPDYLDGNWIINPSMDELAGYSQDYWIIEGNSVRLANSVERTIIDLLLKFKDMNNSQIVDLLHAEINTYRETYINQGIIVNGYLFDIDQRARENITGMCSAISLGVAIPAGFTWRSKLNEDVPMDAPSLVQFGLAAMQFVSTCFAASWAHKDYLTSLIPTATVEDFANYDYTASWPSRSLDGSSLHTPAPDPEI